MVGIWVGPALGMGFEQRNAAIRSFRIIDASESIVRGGCVDLGQQWWRQHRLA
jgi:hypothetical protein